MAKVTGPLLALRAHGDLSPALSYSTHRGTSIAKKPPKHSDPKKLPQLYQRWLFHTARWSWKSLTAGQQAAWKQTGYKYHLTGYQHYMKTYLQWPMDLKLWLDCDDAYYPTMKDRSKHNYPATPYWLSDCLSPINKGVHFDTDASLISIPHTPTLEFTTSDFTVSTFARASGPPVEKYLFHPGLWDSAGWELEIINNSSVDFFSFSEGTHYSTSTGAGALTPGEWFHILLTRKANIATIYINGIDRTSVHGDHPNPAPFPGIFPIGNRPTLDVSCLCDMDDIQIFNRCLHTQQITEIAARRFPIPP